MQCLLFLYFLSLFPFFPFSLPFFFTLFLYSFCLLFFHQLLFRILFPSILPFFFFLSSLVLFVPRVLLVCM